MGNSAVPCGALNGGVYGEETEQMVEKSGGFHAHHRELVLTPL